MMPEENEVNVVFYQEKYCILRPIVHGDESNHPKSHSLKPGGTQFIWLILVSSLIPTFGTMGNENFVFIRKVGSGNSTLDIQPRWPSPLPYGTGYGNGETSYRDYLQEIQSRFAASDSQ